MDFFFFFFFFLPIMSNIWIIVVRCVNPAWQLSGMAKIWTLDVTYILFDRFLSYLPFYGTFTDLDLGSHGQQKAKPFGFIFLHTFQLISMKFDMVLKQFKLNSLRFNETWEITALLLTVSKNLNVSMCLSVYQSGTNLVWWLILLHSTFWF